MFLGTPDRKRFERRVGACEGVCLAFRTAFAFPLACPGWGGSSRTLHWRHRNVIHIGKRASLSTRYAAYVPFV
jgi:hypothetical protein